MMRFEMRGIRKVFGATAAVDGVDLAVAEGEVCALVGQNGAGKSTLMGVLSGALQADAGAMTLDGAPYRPRSPLDARRAGVAMIYQELSLAPHLSVMENMVLGMEPSRFGVIQWDRVRAIAKDVLARLGHPEIAVDAPVETLSVAEQQLVEVGRALAVGPVRRSGASREGGCRVLVLDEPTSSLGREDTNRLFDLIARLKRDGHAIVYISHFIEEVKEVADRIVVLRDGRVAGGGPAADSVSSAHRRPDGRTRRGRSVSSYREASRRGGPRGRRLRAGVGELHAAPWGNPGHRGADRSGANEAAARALRPRARSTGPSANRRS